MIYGLPYIKIYFLCCEMEWLITKLSNYTWCKSYLESKPLYTWVFLYKKYAFMYTIITREYCMLQWDTFYSLDAIFMIPFFYLLGHEFYSYKIVKVCMYVYVRVYVCVEKYEQIFMFHLMLDSSNVYISCKTTHVHTQTEII